MYIFLSVLELEKIKWILMYIIKPIISMVLQKIV